MSSTTKTLLAALAVALFLFAFWSILAGEHMVAGVTFLTASFVIYLRETRG